MCVPSDCHEVCDMDTCNLNHGDVWTEQQGRACGDCHTECSCSNLSEADCHEQCLWEPGHATVATAPPTQGDGRCVKAPPSCLELCDRADFCRWDGNYDQKECFTCRDDCACAARTGTGLCVSPPRPEGRLGWRSMNGDQKWMMHVEPGERFPNTTHDRTFPAPLDKTLDVCAEFCQRGGYTYLGLQWEAECYCSNEYDMRGKSDVHSSSLSSSHRCEFERKC